MKTAKLVLGIISIALCLFVIFQSCAAGIGNAMEGNGEVSGTGGLVVALCMLIAGVVGIATRNGGKGGAITAGGFYLLGGLIGFASAGSYTDLNLWAGVCIAFGLVYIAGTLINKKKTAEQKAKGEEKNEKADL